MPLHTLSDSHASVSHFGSDRWRKGSVNMADRKIWISSGVIDTWSCSRRLMLDWSSFPYCERSLYNRRSRDDPPRTNSATKYMSQNRPRVRGKPIDIERWWYQFRGRPFQICNMFKWVANQHGPGHTLSNSCSAPQGYRIFTGVNAHCF